MFYVRVESWIWCLFLFVLGTIMLKILLLFWLCYEQNFKFNDNIFRIWSATIYEFLLNHFKIWSGTSSSSQVGYAMNKVFSIMMHTRLNSHKCH